MPVSYSAKESKRLGAAIIKFLENHRANKRLAPDQEEGLGVAMQCLTLVFDAVPTDAKDLPELMEAFNKAADDKGIELEKDLQPSDDDKVKAEDAKKNGNDAMKKQKYQSAIDCYTEAIKQDGTTEIYYCNRAAAYTNMEKYHEALDDCKKAISINEDYAKAFSRMALIYSKLQFFDESVACYKTAIELEPDNESYKTNLSKVEAKATQQRNEMAAMSPEQQQQAAMMGMQQGMGAIGGAGAMGMPPGAMGPGMDGMPPGMMEAYQQFATNPEFAKMADTVMTNPEMKGMIDSFMKNAGVTAPEGGATAGEIPADPMAAMGQAMTSGADVNQLMALGQQFAAHMQKENPDLIENLRTQMAGMAPAGEPASLPKSEENGETGDSK